MKTRRAATRGAAERGSAAVPFAIALPVILGFMGLALDLSYIYTRRSELQQIADNMALAAARQLNDKVTGVTNAKSKAADVAAVSYYRFQRSRISWDSSPALSFAKTPNAPDADWKSASAISSDNDAEGRVFAKVDTSKLAIAGGEDPGLIEVIFSRFLPGVGAVVNLSARAVAGPSAVQVTPLAICALDANASVPLAHTGLAAENTEYGFRRGVSYNLLDLSPTGTAQNYLVNPIDPGSAANNVDNLAAAYVKPFFCAGTMALPHVGVGTKVHVQALGGLDIHDWLNSRFNDYPGSAGCNVATAPPDTNIREFIGGYTNWYMAAAPSPYPASASSVTRNGSRVSFADLVQGDAYSGSMSPDNFGPLWTYSKPVPVSGTPYAVADWNKLYKFDNGTTVVTAVGDATKYGNSAGAYLSSNHISLAPSSTNPIANRRVLNIPLLACAGGTPATPASVLAIGRFFMTAKAKQTPPLVPGEFAGVLSGGPTTSVVLYQ